MKNKKQLFALTLATAAMLSGCLFDSSSNGKETNTATNHVVFAMTSDYQTGALRWVESNASKDSVSENSYTFNQDAMLVGAGSKLYVLERYGADNLVRLDAAMLPQTAAVEYQISLGTGANPEDVAVVNDTLAWLALSGRNYLLAFDPASGKAKDSVDISAFAGANEASPQPVKMALYGDTLCVIMQRLEMWSVTKPGLLALFNAHTGKLLDTLQLKGRNPQSMILDGARLLVACEGSTMDTTAPATTKSIDVVDLKALTVKVLVTSTSLGGGPGVLALDAKTKVLYASVFHSWGHVTLASVNASTGAVTTAEIPGVSDLEGGMAFDTASNLLYVGDRSLTAGGVKTYDGSTVATLDNGKALPPVSLAIASW